MQNKGKYYLTSAIAYATAKPHIGNVYEIVLSDAIARYRRQQGYEVYFQTGADEHGQKVELNAKEAGLPPQEHVSQVSQVIQDQWDMMGTSYDCFMRTTDEAHQKEVQSIFKHFYDKGDIYKGEYEGLYCNPCESFFTDSQLIDGKCPDCGREVGSTKEEAYFFKMSNYADRLIEYINSHPDFILPISRKNEMMNNFLLPGLHDLCVSRTSFKWGIPVTFDEKHVVYVWLDALTNYITVIGFHADKNLGSEDGFETLWPADLQLVGKDIIRFHTIYWPIILMALDLPLPKTILGHPWLLMGDGKMSKSKGNVLYADALVSVFGLDAVRYYLLHEMQFDHDGIITWELLVERINSDLANTIGNLVNRTINMSNKYFDGVVTNPECTDAIDKEFKSLISSCRDKVAEKMDALKIADALDEVVQLFRRCNKYIDETLPWALAKDESKSDRLKTVLYNLIDAIQIGASLLKPFIPTTADKILAQINCSAVDYDLLDKCGQYPSGTKVTETPEILFARLKLEEVLALAETQKGAEKSDQAVDTTENTEKSAETTDSKFTENNEEKIREEIYGVAQIGIDDFAKVDFRIAEITACEPIKRAKKLLKLTLNDGTGILRTVASGIALWYKPDDLIGRRIVVVSNLKPAKLCGVESQGMILAADGANDSVQVIFVDGVPVGSKVR